VTMASVSLPIEMKRAEIFYNRLETGLLFRLYRAVVSSSPMVRQVPDCPYSLSRNHTNSNFTPSSFLHKKYSCNVKCFKPSETE